MGACEVSDESSEVAQTCVKHMRTPVACGTKSTRCMKVYQAYGTGTEFTDSTGGVKVNLNSFFVLTIFQESKITNRVR